MRGDIKMKKLVLVKESPFSGALPSFVWKNLNRGDTILFIQDGVIFGHAMPDNLYEEIKELREKGIELLILEPDLKLRGIHLSFPDMFKTIDYEEFAKLVEESEKIAA